MKRTNHYANSKAWTNSISPRPAVWHKCAVSSLTDHIHCLHLSTSVNKVWSHEKWKLRLLRGSDSFPTVTLLFDVVKNRSLSICLCYSCVKRRNFNCLWRAQLFQRSSQSHYKINIESTLLLKYKWHVLIIMSDYTFFNSKIIQKRNHWLCNSVLPTNVICLSHLQHQI